MANFTLLTMIDVGPRWQWIIKLEQNKCKSHAH